MRQKLRTDSVPTSPHLSISQGSEHSDAYSAYNNGGGENDRGVAAFKANILAKTEKVKRKEIREDKRLAKTGGKKKIEFPEYDPNEYRDQEKGADGKKRDLNASNILRKMDETEEDERYEGDDFWEFGKKGF